MVKHKELGLLNERLIEMYKTMILTRMIDEKNWLLNRSGKTPFVVSGQGQEACQIGMSFALEKGKDYMAPYYRDLGCVLSFGMTAKEVMLSYLAKKDDPNSGGRQMPNHFGCKRLKILSQSSPVTTHLTHVVGIAYALKISGINDVVCIASFGEGSSNQMDFYDSINFASIYKLPVIFACENNGYAISIPVNKQISSKNVAERAKGLGLPGESVDGMDVLASYQATKKAADLARKGEGPTLLEFNVKRFTAHSSDDSVNSYMTKEEIEQLKKVDPIESFKEYLIENKIIDQKQDSDLREKIAFTVDEATSFAESAADPNPEDALNCVYE